MGTNGDRPRFHVLKMVKMGTGPVFMSSLSVREEHVRRIGASLSDLVGCAAYGHSRGAFINGACPRLSPFVALAGCLLFLLGQFILGGRTAEKLGRLPISQSSESKPAMPKALARQIHLSWDTEIGNRPTFPKDRKANVSTSVM